MFVTTEGHASWTAPLTMKAHAPMRLATWKRLPAFNQPMETDRYADRIRTAPDQPAISHSSSMMSFRGDARLPSAGGMKTAGYACAWKSGPDIPRGPVISTAIMRTAHL
ncbi:hypothetical protein D9M68_961630 [compost metagenome]